MLANELKYKGFFKWTAEHLETIAGGMPSSAAFAFVVVFFYFVHYGFASVPRSRGKSSAVAAAVRTERNNRYPNPCKTAANIISTPLKQPRIPL